MIVLLFSAASALNVRGEVHVCCQGKYRVQVGKAQIHLSSIRGACLCELLQAKSGDSPSWADICTRFNKKNVMGRVNGGYLKLLYKTGRVRVVSGFVFLILDISELFNDIFFSSSFSLLKKKMIL